MPGESPIPRLPVSWKELLLTRMRLSKEARPLCTQIHSAAQRQGKQKGGSRNTSRCVTNLTHPKLWIIHVNRPESTMSLVKQIAGVLSLYSVRRCRLHVDIYPCHGYNNRPGQARDAPLCFTWTKTTCRPTSLAFNCSMNTKDIQWRCSDDSIFFRWVTMSLGSIKGLALLTCWTLSVELFSLVYFAFQTTGHWENDAC